jgi:serine protease Do
MSRIFLPWLATLFLATALATVAVAQSDSGPDAAEGSPPAAEPQQPQESTPRQPAPEETPSDQAPPKPETQQPPADKPSEPSGDKQDAPAADDQKGTDQGKQDKGKNDEQPEESKKPEQKSEEPQPKSEGKDGKKDKKSDDKSADGTKGDKQDKSDRKKTDRKAKAVKEPQPRRVEWDDEVAKVLAKPSPENVEDLKVIQRQLQRVVAAATPATVSVRVGNAFGSAVIVSPDGLALTAGHVVGQPNADVTFIFPDGKTAKGKTLGMNQQIDSGMMKITDPGPWPFVEVAKAGEIEGGQWVVAIGQPGGFDGERTPPVRLGRVLFANGEVINTDCTLVGGDSGGPLFNMKGQVVGIHSRIGRRITNNFHVPISTYHQTWDRLAAAESWGSRLGGAEPVRSWPMLGIAGKRGSDRCELTQVHPSRPAAIAGLKVGDVITSFAGKPVTSIEQLGKLVAEQKPLATVDVEVKRGDEELKLKVRLGMTNRRIPGSYGENS